MPKSRNQPPLVKPPESPNVRCQIDLGQIPSFSANYLGDAPLSVLAAYGASPMHRFLLQREEWEHDRILADKGPLITLTNGVQIGSQPAHMELAAIIIGLALRRWYLPPQQGDTIYSDCKSLTDVLNSATPQLSKFPAELPFL